jgi:hypothetical protein
MIQFERNEGPASPVSHIPEQLGEFGSCAPGQNHTKYD